MEIQTMSQVKVPNAFFAKSKLEYQDWRWAFFRELIQNSSDAGATRIDFGVNLIVVEGLNCIEITCHDNGSGMERDTIENVLLSLGGSLKLNGSVGGFGYAKSLLFLAHKSYEIRTKGWIVRGSGGSYSITAATSPVSGTYIKVCMDSEGKVVSDFEDKLDQYVRYMTYSKPMQIGCAGTQTKFTGIFTDYEYVHETILGTLSFREIHGSTSYIIVSVRGLPMFIHTVYVSGNSSFSGLLELKGDSFDLLTSNRDSLKGIYRDQFSRIIQSMIENRSALKLGKSLDITLNFEKPITVVGSGTEQTGVRILNLPLVDKRGSSLEDSLRYLTNVDYPKNFNLRIQNAVGRGGADKLDSTVDVTTVLGLLKKGWVKSLAVAWSHAVWQVLSTKFSSTQVRFVGNDGRVVPHEDGYYLDSGAFFLGSQRVSAGFILAPSIEGLCVKSSDIEQDILILCNPMTFDKKFNVGDLLDLAIHECSHLQVSGHNELFVDVDMKHRRSFRRHMSEENLKDSVKSAILLQKQQGY